MFDLVKAQQTVADFQALIDRTPHEKGHVRLTPEAWTLTEIIGHLIDSASNNHQRFVRLRFGDLDNFPAYDAEPWIAAQAYDELEFKDAAGLWALFNGYLLTMLANTPKEALENVWRKKEWSQSLDFLMTDYYEHMQLHVTHYRERLAELP